MKNRELYVLERSAAILYDSEECVVISLNKTYSEKKKENVQIYSSKSLSGIRNLKAQVRTCAGVIFKNKNNYVLTHAVWEYNQENLKGLLKRILNLSIMDTGKNPDEVFLCTTYPEEQYEEAIYEILEDVDLKKFRKYNGKLGVLKQNIAIGKDVLSFY